jgi:hypothetical protein
MLVTAVRALASRIFESNNRARCIRKPKRRDSTRFLGL